MISKINPWLTMWTHPRGTVRHLIETKPTQGSLLLASMYTLQLLFYLLNYWSIGLFYPFHLLFFLSILLSPFIGWIWLFFTGWVLYGTGKLFKGKAPLVHLRCAIAWSKIPTTFSLLMWLILMMNAPGYAFIQDAQGVSVIFITFITLIVTLWSLVLLIQSVREVQAFPLLSSIGSVLLAWIFFWIFFFLMFLASYFIYKSIS